jgi:hypothetical protein
MRARHSRIKIYFTSGKVFIVPIFLLVFVSVENGRKQRCIFVDEALVSLVFTKVSA